MASSREKPDPYGPRKTIVAASTPKPVEIGSRSQAELFNDGLRAMLHEHPEEAREYLEAVATAEALAARDGLAVDAMAFLSSVRWSLGDVDGAMEASDRALELAPTRFAPNQKAGEMAIRLGDLDRAADLFLAALRACEPGTPDAKAAEISLLETRRRVGRGIRHGASAPRLGGWISRIVPSRRGRRASSSVAAG
jgi:hypothetical protein